MRCWVLAIGSTLMITLFLGSQERPGHQAQQVSREGSGTDLADISEANNTRVVDSSKYTSIQAAIDDLPASGGTVDARGLRGPQRVTATITLNKPVQLLLGAATFAAADSAVDPILDITADDVAIIGLGYTSTSIQHLQQDPNLVRVAPGTDNIRIEGIDFHAGGKTEVDEGWSIGNGLIFDGTPAKPITNVSVTQNRFSDGHNQIVLRNTEHARITDNLFAVSHRAQAHIQGRSSNWVIISRNFFRQTIKAAPTLIWTARDSRTSKAQRGWTISDNVFDVDDIYAELINLGSLTYSSVTSNVIEVRGMGPTSGGVGIRIARQSGAGSGAPQPHHISVIGNVIHLTGGGNTSTNAIRVVNLDSDSNMPIYAISVIGNVIDMNLSNGSSAILFRGVQRSAISGNTIDFTSQSALAQHGIHIQKSTAQTPNEPSNDITVSGNTIYNAKNDGIRIEASERVAVVGNVVESSGTGIALANARGTNHNLVVGNIIGNNRIRGLTIGAAAGRNNLVGWNHFSGNATNMLFNTLPEEWVGANGKYITSSTFSAPIGHDGSGFEHSRFGATCTTAAVGGATCTTTYEWTSTFGDVNYTPVCWGVYAVGTPILTLDNSQRPGSIMVRVTAATPVASSFRRVYCVAVHD